MIKLYKTQTCPKCQRLKQFLNVLGLQFTEVDMETPTALTELYADGVFVNEAPVLFIDGAYYAAKEIFSGLEVNEALVRKLTGRF